jgi:hypothetical protein
MEGDVSGRYKNLGDYLKDKITSIDSNNTKVTKKADNIDEMLERFKTETEEW